MIRPVVQAYAKTAILHETGATVFRDAGFDAVFTGLCTVSTKQQLKTPTIFKSEETQAHGRRPMFRPLLILWIPTVRIGETFKKIKNGAGNN